MNDEQLRAVYARTSPARPGCAAPEEILALVQRDGAEADRLRILDHVMSCAECRGDFDLIRAVEIAGREDAAGATGELSGELSGEPPRLSAKSTSGPHRSWLREHAPILAAAAVLLPIGIGVGTLRQWRSTPRSTADIVRGAPENVAGAGSVVPILPAEGDSSAEPVQLVWHAAQGAVRYRVELLGADGALVGGTTTTDTVFVVPSSLLHSGTDYSWWVRAETGTGEARSSLRRFRILSAK